MWDMDIYSTVLWHLQKDVPLSFLAQELVTINDQSPQSWIATGNCFSLQRDHGQALTCFKRATSLDPRCAYGYALSGHEALALDDQESAVGFFRTALRTDGRHYPAWCVVCSVHPSFDRVRTDGATNMLLSFWCSFYSGDIPSRLVIWRSVPRRT